MTTLLHLGGQMVALEHIVRAEFTEADPGGEEIDQGDRIIVTSPRQASLQLTLTSQHSEEHIHDLDHGGGYHVAASSENDLVVLRGDAAIELWFYLEHQAIDPIEAMVPG